LQSIVSIGHGTSPFTGIGVRNITSVPWPPSPHSEDRIFFKAFCRTLRTLSPLTRRRWPAETKARILEQALAPGANISAVARANGVRPQQLFAWRRRAIRSGAITIAEDDGHRQSFAAVEVAHDDGARAGGLDIIIGDATIRVASDVAPALLVEAIRAVRSA
jgi:transposase